MRLPQILSDKPLLLLYETFLPQHLSRLSLSINAPLLHSSAYRTQSILIFLFPHFIVKHKTLALSPSHSATSSVSKSTVSILLLVHPRPVSVSAWSTKADIKHRPHVALFLLRLILPGNKLLLGTVPNKSRKSPTQSTVQLFSSTAKRRSIPFWLLSLLFFFSFLI